MKTEKKIGGRCPEGCITDPRCTKLESQARDWEERRQMMGEARVQMRLQRHRKTDGLISFTKCLNSYLRCILMVDEVSFNHVTHRNVLATVLISQVYMTSVLSFSSGKPNALKPNAFVTTTSGIIRYSSEWEAECEGRSWKNEGFSNLMVFSSEALRSVILTNYYSGD
jgi:hypothetical protein